MPKRDPNKPKAAKNAYQYFMDEQREENNTKSEDEKLDFASLSKAGAEEWKSLSDDDREPYNVKAGKDKKRYLKEMESYVPPSDSDSDDDAPKRKKRKPKDPNAPKKPQSAYFQFANVNRQKTKEELIEAGRREVKITDVAAKLGEKWRGMTGADKEPYEKLAEKDKERYQKDMEAYNGSRN